VKVSHLQVPPRPPARVVTLGARGFIARHLRDWCARNSIECLALGSDELDLTAPESAQRLSSVLHHYDAVIMTSALTPDKGRDYLALMNNLRMAETVCRALAQQPCAHFVYLSSDAVYDASKIPLNEDSTREPTDLYALCHTAREMMFSAELEKARIPICILRLTALYGPGDTHNAYGPNRFVRCVLKNESIKLFGNGEELRSHVYIDDALELIGLVLSHLSTGTLNVAAEHAVSFAEVAEIVLGLSGNSVPIDSVARMGPQQISHRPFVNSAIFEAFPEFSFIPLATGLARYIEAESK
jgi:nucleoside-diphosphate-sugar epimerase